MLRKVLLICFCVIGFISCKDLKNWDSKYTSHLNISLEAKKDTTNHPQSLLASLLEEECFYLSRSTNSISEEISVGTLHTLKTTLANSMLEPDVRESSFELYNKDYYHKVTVEYEVVASLISPEAGGIHKKYTIKQIKLIPETATQGSLVATRKPIFTDCLIEQPVLLENKKVNVKLFY